MMMNNFIIIYLRRTQCAIMIRLCTLDLSAQARARIHRGEMASTTSRVLCKYFMNGACAKGNGCEFSHDWKDNPNMTCKYYLQGNCSYGSKCRYNHFKPEREKAKKTQSVVPAPISLPSALNSTTPAPKMVTLKKNPSKNPKLWTQAPEFIPGKRFHGKEDENEQSDAPIPPPSTPPPYLSYSDVALSGTVEDGEFLDIITPEEASKLLCPFAEMGVCPFEDNKCEYLHGDICDMCNRQCLNPFDPEQRKAHQRDCVAFHEKAMAESFQLQASEGKVCGICMEVVVAKPSLSERRFAILSECDHCFCLGCIRKWRGSTHSRKKTIRACPLCRKISFFVIPSEVWIFDPKEKEVLAEEYKSNLKKKPCMHFDMGKGTCPFGNSCFYKHCYPDGTDAVLSIRVCTGSEGDSKAVKGATLWDFITERDDRHTTPPVDHYWTDEDDN